MNERTDTSGEPGAAAYLWQRRWVRVLTTVLAIPTVLALVFGVYLWQRFGTDRATEYPDIEEHFKYGSTGGEHVSGLSRTGSSRRCRRSAANTSSGKGYASLGMIYEEGKDLPIGMSMRHHQGIDKTFLNCAVCHASTVRDTPQAKPRVYLGMPAKQLDIMAFEKFFFNCAKDAEVRRRIHRAGSAAPWPRRAGRISTSSTATSSIRWRSR